MNNVNGILNVPISQDILDRLNTYIELTGVSASDAVEFAINQLTSQYIPNKGFPKKGIVTISGKEQPCFILERYANDYSQNKEIELLKILTGRSISYVKAKQVKILSD